jgi:hypothetical protein
MLGLAYALRSKRTAVLLVLEPTAKYSRAS